MPEGFTHHLGFSAHKPTEYAVNGTNIPDVDFDIGESYAGLMPISKAANESSQLYFWFFPSENPDASEEILIWLNGGVSTAWDQNVKEEVFTDQFPI